MENYKEKIGVEVDGHVFIKDVDTGEVLLDKHNAINFENIALAIAHTLSNKTDADNKGLFINKMAFGNGGTIIDATGSISYKTPNTSNSSGTLYHKTYQKTVDEVETGNNKMEVVPYPNYPYSDLVVTATLDYNEPDGQGDFDTSASFDGDFIFDEIGLAMESGEDSADDSTIGKLISHIVFHPIQKSANRKIQVIYTLRIRAGS